MITACIIARDAERNIVKCLNSIKDYCGEAVIALDTRTVDNTREVLMNYTDIDITIYDYEWVTDSFSDARNYIQSKANGKWVLVIDCDEVLDNHIEPSEEYDAYTVKVLEYKNGIVHTVFPSPRLYKSDIGVRFNNSTHEENHSSLIGYNLFKSDMVIHSEEKTEEQALAKTKWLLERAKKELKTAPDNEYLLGQIGTYYQTLCDYNESNKWLHRSMFKNVSYAIKAQAAIRIFINYQKIDNTDCDNAMYWLYLSLALCPEQLQARYILYQIYKNDNQPELAEEEKQNILKIGNNSKLPYDVEFTNIKF